MNQAQVEKVIQTLQMAQTVTNEVKMSQDQAFCGSPACHAGHYAIGKYLLGEAHSPATFMTGVWQMSKDLGVGNLSTWAFKNPEIWGNADGMEVFTRSEAFGIHTGEEITLDHIIEHWKGVRDRLEE